MQIISRDEAISLNLKRYFTGEPCNYGHISERKITCRTCVECHNIKVRAARATQEQKIKESEYRSSDEYKRRKNLKARLSRINSTIQREIDRLANKERAGVRYVSKQEAIEFGLSRYFDGSLCKRGHMSERSTSNGCCCQCSIEIAARPDRLKTKRSYYNENKDRFAKSGVIRQRERYAENPEYKASVAVRNMLKRVLRKAKTKKYGGSYEILGYDGGDLMSHMESLFVDGMSWDNYGEWHIDHVIPVSWWFKNGVEDPATINALSNLQPLWKQDNLDKRDKLICL